MRSAIKSLFLILATLLTACPAAAQITQITLHPASAVIEERVTGPTAPTPTGPALTVTLPRSADPASYNFV